MTKSYCWSCGNEDARLGVPAGKALYGVVDSSRVSAGGVGHVAVVAQVEVEGDGGGVAVAAVDEVPLGLAGGVEVRTGPR